MHYPDFVRLLHTSTPFTSVELGMRGEKQDSFTIYRALYGDAMLKLICMSSNMADGNQQKHLLPSFATKA